MRVKKTETPAPLLKDRPGVSVFSGLTFKLEARSIISISGDEEPDHRSTDQYGALSKLPDKSWTGRGLALVFSSLKIA